MGPFSMESTWKVNEQWVGWFVLEYTRIDTPLLVSGVVPLLVIFLDVCFRNVDGNSLMNFVVCCCFCEENKNICQKAKMK